MEAETVMQDAEEYLPSPDPKVRDQVERYERSGGRDGGTSLRGFPVVILTTRGAKSGKLRKSPVIRVEHEGRYLAVASFGGAPENPLWYGNISAYPHIKLQDGPARRSMIARELSGAEKEEWWERAVAAYPEYAEYQTKTEREIPILLLEEG
jgi:deazaflavin-dependent oxidoreductase (nitroreductase family)